MTNTNASHNISVTTNEVQNLDRISITLRPHGREALSLSASLTGDNQTDTINKALRLYSEYLQAERGGRGTYIRRASDSLTGEGELERIRFF